MNEHPRNFYSKVMLFGEYSLIVGSQALTIPFRKFSGSLRFVTDSPLKSIEEPDQSESHVSGRGDGFDMTSASKKNSSFSFDAYNSGKHLQAYYEYLSGKKNDPILIKGLKEQTQPDSFAKLLNLDAFNADIFNGIYFDSDIPNGSGVGSSGALVAAVYERYAYLPLSFSKTSDSYRLKSILSAMECWFHGSSSGIDPLSCYMNTGLFLDTAKQKAFRAIKAFPPLAGTFFLVDTQIVGKTSPLVKTFLEKAENPDFRHFLSKQYVAVNNTCISAVIDGDGALLEKSIRNISELQLHHFREMIPDEFIDMWTFGLVSGAYSLKLCGSGGGGFLLGFAGNPGVLGKLFPKHRWLQIPLP